jgi:hypothetical protein
MYLAQTRAKSKHAYHFINSAGRLAEFYTITQAVKADRHDLECQKAEVLKHSAKRKITLNSLRTAVKNRLENTALKGKDLGTTYTIPAKFPGSRAFYKKAYADLLTLVRVHGAPTLYSVTTYSIIEP